MKQSSRIERTLIIFKPDSVQRGVVGEILNRFERVGLKIVGAKMISPTKDQFFDHYEKIGKMVTRRGEKTFTKCWPLVDGWRAACLSDRKSRSPLKTFGRLQEAEQASISMHSNG